MSKILFCLPPIFPDDLGKVTIEEPTEELIAGIPDSVGGGSTIKDIIRAKNIASIDLYNSGLKNLMIYEVPILDDS